MNLHKHSDYDVLVVGSGIAGLMAALEAARAGCRTAIASSTHLFSGSSFYPGTWGFGLIGPSDETDIDDLIETIQNVGCQIPDPEMVRAFVTDINPTIEYLETLGCHPKKASENSQREFIPCFDHKHRNWNGLESDMLRQTFTEQLRTYHVSILDQHTLLDLVTSADQICGTVFSTEKDLTYISCKALILATGGYGSLFKNHLCTNDVSGYGHYLALKYGCTLINMEFMQMMPGYLSPARNTIFNEKTFRFAHFHNSDGSPVFSSDETALLDERSTHGPFTCRLNSCGIDHKLYKVSLENVDGVAVSYADAAKNNPPEFIQIYFDWLKTAKHVDVSDTIHIGIFSHAANGGIQIDPHGFTGVSNLFACGEVTGGMHGADRIGGLSTANGLVFGRRTGRCAASHVLEQKESLHVPQIISFEPWTIPNRTEIRKQLQNLMYAHAMVHRNEKGLTLALNEVEKLLSHLEKIPSSDPKAISDARILEGQLWTAKAILSAALLRKESRGSHYRADYPQSDPSMARSIHISCVPDFHVSF